MKSRDSFYETVDHFFSDVDIPMENQMAIKSNAYDSPSRPLGMAMQGKRLDSSPLASYPFNMSKPLSSAAEAAAEERKQQYQKN